jgi:hypothetical protein
MGAYFPQKIIDLRNKLNKAYIWICSQKTIRLSIGEKIILIMDKVIK